MGITVVGPQEPPAPTVPSRVTNFQARYVMRSYKMSDGRSLFTTVDTDLRAAVDAYKDLDEFDPKRVEADVHWQAWEQANEYERYGQITELLKSKYGFDDATTDELFTQASQVRA